MGGNHLHSSALCAKIAAMATNVEVQKNNNENNATLLRRFSKRMQSSGILRRVKSERYNDRLPSDYTKKKRKLKSLRRHEEVAKLIKLGKMAEKRPSRR